MAKLGLTMNTILEIMFMASYCADRMVLNPFGYDKSDRA